MSENSSIEWTDHTFNPWWGCTKISPGCTNCYAERWGARRNTRWGARQSRLLLSDNHWKQPGRWDRRAEKAGMPALVFCASLADVFDKDAPRRERKRLWRIIDSTPHLRWQLLTKRPELILETIPEAWRRRAPRNVWYGTSVESADFTWRIKELAKVPAVVRFLSVEPLLGPIPRLPLRGIDWVILGGESGPGARAMEAGWARQIRDRVTKRKVPLFFKQWGQHDSDGCRHRSKSFPGCDVLDGQRWRQSPGG